MADSIKSSGTARLPSSSELARLRALLNTDAAVREDWERRMLLVLASGTNELALGITPCCCKLNSDGASDAVKEDWERRMLLVLGMRPAVLAGDAPVVAGCPFKSGNVKVVFERGVPLLFVDTCEMCLASTGVA